MSRFTGGLSEEQVDEFKNRGILVVKSVYSKEEVECIRNGLHDNLRSSVGCDVNDLAGTASNLSKLSSTAGAGGILDVFYAPWKLEVNQDPRLFALASEIWSRTYAENQAPFDHPFAAFNPHHGYMYIDRVGFRVPDSISMLHKGGKKKKGLQRSLTPHLDCCPHKLYDDINKWRPVQMFVALTDTREPNQGGFEACHSLHSNFNEWVSTRAGIPSVSSSSGDASGACDHDSEPPPCVGSFTPIRPKEDADILERIEHIPCEAGDIVCWDYRIPHANSRYNNTDRAREVLYLGK